MGFQDESSSTAARLVGSCLAVTGILLTSPTTGETASAGVPSGVFAGMDADSPACGDFNEDGSVTASDALGTLSFSIGLGNCPVCVCDVDSSGSTTATDALKILRGAVGLPEVFECPPDGVPLAWTGNGDGVSWADGANWETGIAPTGCEAVTIDDTGGLEVVFDIFADDTTVHSITSDAGFLLTGPTQLRVRHTMDITGPLTLDGGFLVDAEISAASGGPGGITVLAGDTRMIGTTVHADVSLAEFSARFKIRQGMTFNGTMTLSGFLARVEFDGDFPQTLDGAGEIVLGSDAITFDVVLDQQLTIGEMISIRGGGGATVGGDGVLINRGTIEADGSGPLTIRGLDWRNEGTVVATTGNVDWSDNGTNDGVVRVAPGTTIQASAGFVQGPAGRLIVEIDGAGSNGGIDATGQAVTLDGTLEPSLLGGYEPGVGESFEVARFGSVTGGFAAIDGADFAPGKTFMTATDADSIDLQVISTGLLPSRRSASPGEASED
jgi:hypothetical protein